MRIFTGDKSKKQVPATIAAGGRGEEKGGRPSLPNPCGSIPHIRKFLGDAYEKGSGDMTQNFKFGHVPAKRKKLHINIGH